MRLLPTLLAASLALSGCSKTPDSRQTAPNRHIQNNREKMNQICFPDKPKKPPNVHTYYDFN